MAQTVRLRGRDGRGTSSVVVNIILLLEKDSIQLSVHSFNL